ncbi:MAG: hypothetical protein OXM56_10940 [Gammaproteobacteria bacterium]|nr:hypothetical protein [Gammaproteobacteria bacterium]
MKRIVAAALCAVATTGHAVEPVGTLVHPALSEVSGIVKSEAGEFYWVHNDSGDTARVFALDPHGTPLKPPFIDGSPADWPGHVVDNAWHYDWEDIALADGTLYIADVGNNGNSRRDMGVYVVREPDPRAVAKMRAHAFLPIRYPDQEHFPAKVWHFDCEAVFVDRGKLHFITKHRQAGKAAEWEAGAKLYRLDTEHTDRDNVLTLVSRRDDVFLATGADLSPDGSRLAVATYVALWIFDRPATGGNWFAGKAWKLDLDLEVTKQLEAIAWEGPESLVLVNENRDVMRVAASAFSELP